jgi:hypothetical protein
MLERIISQTKNGGNHPIAIAALPGAAISPL